MEAKWTKRNFIFHNIILYLEHANFDDVVLAFIPHIFLLFCCDHLTFSTNHGWHWIAEILRFVLFPAHQLETITQQNHRRDFEYIQKKKS